MNRWFIYFHLFKQFLLIACSNSYNQDETWPPWSLEILKVQIGITRNESLKCQFHGSYSIEFCIDFKILQFGLVALIHVRH